MDVLEPKPSEELVLAAVLLIGHDPASNFLRRELKSAEEASVFGMYGRERVEH